MGESKQSYPRIYNKIVLTLENSLLPEEKLEETPSGLDGLDKETEKDLRILGCELIQSAGILLRLPQVAMATGQILFQRFYYSKSFVRHNMETAAMSSLCLASKIEEAPRRIRDVINVIHHIKQVRAQKDILPMILDETYTNMKNQVIKAERRILKELGFCVHVKHPHKLIVMYLQVLGYEKHKDLMQMAWNYMNDSLRTDVFMRYQPETIACACIYLTARRLDIPLPNNPPWFGIFKVSESDIIDICYRVEELYKRQKPNVEKLNEVVDKLKKKYMESRNKTKEQNTPPAVTTVDRNNGSHNAWGGFIQRALPLPTQTETKTKLKHSKSKTPESRSGSRSRSRSRSRSKSKSASVSDDYKRSFKKSRNKKKSRHYSRSLSPSSSPHSKQRNRSRIFRERDQVSGAKEREKEFRRKGKEFRSSKHESYSSSRSSHHSGKHRDRSRDRKR
ncbi:cyclin-L1 [Condylostylus longicornis]|uniref:cyclin-L1 n=1 Tax=Condylostylus longicornis TaxID=2530218 RepID=UPI00244E1854|nr:cyclin-L1 [Condylostylus longicornis]